ncbi:MAG TPA: deoxyribodipyrimidine photo-lyase [Thiomicrospira sp.]|nr:deoxyribodipyrimidine photo-lyase [Thiomicrospira sp.]
MKKPIIQIVWFKRDLRTIDHAPLYMAVQKGVVLPVYIFEPELWLQKDASLRHWRFIHDCLIELNHNLNRLGQPLIQLYGEVIEVFEQLQNQYQIAGIWSHQETGNLWTFARDQKVLAWLKQRNIPWNEFKQHPIHRGKSQRDYWQSQANQFFNQACLPEPDSLTFVQAQKSLPNDLPLPPAISHKEQIQKGGRSLGLKLLNRFLTQRVGNYLFDIANPIKAPQNSSRLSPHLTWGSLSIREVIQAAQLRQSLAPANQQRGLTAFISRCFWQSHFMQKLETEPQMERHCLHAATEYLRAENPNSQKFLQAWLKGQTGVPMVDACMRCLKVTGWLPFRMRAMVVSFASYQLWIDWRLIAPPLAQLFTDYEPGIHYSQIQMQSGTTGINAMRVYSPVKQGKDHDPLGLFIKTWCPELQAVPVEYIHQPWTMPVEWQNHFSVFIGQDYPAPLVDIDESAKQAKDALASLRKDPDAKRQAKSVFITHGSRAKRTKNTRSKTAKNKTSSPGNTSKNTVPDNQLSLF